MNVLTPWECHHADKCIKLGLSLIRSDQGFQALTEVGRAVEFWTVMESSMEEAVQSFINQLTDPKSPQTSLVRIGLVASDDYDANFVLSGSPLESGFYKFGTMNINKRVGSI